MVQALLIAAALGLLVGLQREWSKSRVAGIRTFPLITLFGALVGGIGEDFTMVVSAGLLAVAAMLVVANVAKIRAGAKDPGMTTEFAALAMYGVGVAVTRGQVLPAIVVTGCVAVLLQFKETLHSFASSMDEADIRAGARLALIALVILPALPDQGYGPYGVINPFRVWLMVVLIVGISLAAYVSYRLLGARAGSWSAGLLGGLISSTATTTTYAQRALDPTRLAGSTAVIVTASAVVFGRVLLEIAVVGPAVFAQTAPPLALMMCVMAMLAYLSQRHVASVEPEPEEPPSTMKTAIVFGLMYAVVLFAIAASRQYFGSIGMFAVAALSGLTDVDAITLSTVHLVDSGGLAADLGWRLILTGIMSNLLFKAGIVAVIGSTKTLRTVAPYFATALLCGTLLLIFWR
ncbi:MAG: DUF4010 domain-containing protein [Acidobacteria bacterium]|nr:DUF4010 domain-containing protein [Acidobacteriota bacterium]MDA1234519.1 DUF4010 domain-containing protein [Acidobacteriota bacterium]